MTPAKNRRTAGRVEFARGINVQIVAIDGTWRRQCTMQDVSETGAKLKIEGSVEKLDLKEFFLILSSTGLAFRRCELAWINGDQIGTSFKNTETKKAAKRAID
jgi:PilZ domain